MRIHGQVLGTKALQAVMKNLRNLDMTAIDRALLTCGYRIHREAVTSIMRGAPRTGVVYRRGGKATQRSAPGEVPKTDTGMFANSIYVKLEDKPDGRRVCWIGSDLKYSRGLELGTKNMGARPWLVPAFEKTRAENRKTLEAALNSAVKSTAQRGGGR